MAIARTQQLTIVEVNILCSGKLYSQSAYNYPVLQLYEKPLSAIYYPNATHNQNSYSPTYPDAVYNSQHYYPEPLKIVLPSYSQEHTSLLPIQAVPNKIAVQPTNVLNIVFHTSYLLFYYTFISIQNLMSYRPIYRITFKMNFIKRFQHYMLKTFQVYAKLQWFS